jgi:hypothetical protein
MSTSLTNRPDLEALLAVLPTDWRERAQRHRLVIEHPDTRLADAETVMRFVMLHVGCDIPLRQTVRWIAEAGGPEVSHVSLHRKMRRIGPLLQELVGVMADGRAESRAEQWAGYEPIVVDGSVVVTPGPTSAGGRLHVALRLADLGVVGAAITTTSDGETLRRFPWSKDQLVIADRGYANPVGVAHVVNEHADLIVRVNRGALPLLDDEGERIDLLAWVRGLQGRRAQHRAAIVRHGSEIRGRLVAARLPADKVDDARRRVRAEVGDDAEALELAEWMLLFTTVPAHRLTDAQIIRAYRLRWQVELLFKRWKSLCHIDKLPNYREDTLVSWLSAKILLLLCAERLASPANSRLSPPIHQANTTLVLHRFRAAAVEAHLHPLAGDLGSAHPHVTA